MKSTLSTVVSVVRNGIGLSAGEFGTLIGKPINTVKKLESGRLPLSEKTALAISKETGVSLAWLLAGDPKAPIVDQLGGEWTRAAFESAEGERQYANLEAMLEGLKESQSIILREAAEAATLDESRDTPAIRDRFISNYLTIWAGLLWKRLCAVINAQEVDKAAILCAKVDRFVQEIEREHGTVVSSRRELLEAVAKNRKALTRNKAEVKIRIDFKIPPSQPSCGSAHPEGARTEESPRGIG